MLPNAMGNITFHPNLISWSYRSLGNVARSQKKRNKKEYVLTANHIVFSTQAKDGSPTSAIIVPGYGAFHPPRNSAAATQDTSTMLAYSARKKKANLRPLYSVKKPATSSLSASGRSKGTRLVSATDEIT